MVRRLLALVVLLWLAAPAATLEASEPTTVQVFQVRFRSVTDVAAAVQTVLSEEGSLTVHPRQSRITVQDRPEVVSRVAEMIARMDRSPDRYLIEVVLLQGVTEELPPAQRAAVDARLKRMFPFASYRRIGATSVDGVIGQPAAAELGEGHRVSFLASSLGIANDTPWGIPDTGNRIHLQPLTLSRITTDRSGQQRSMELLKTSVYLSQKQEVFIGAGASEDSKSGLVLILQASQIGGE
jgi:hypothetical protein